MHPYLAFALQNQAKITELIGDMVRCESPSDSPADVDRFVDLVIEATREFARYIFNVHLKDTEILSPLVRRGGIRPVDNAKWWRFRLPGSGVIDWKGFFTALADAGYTGGLNIENEDQFYYPSYEGADFTEAFKEGFRVAHAYVRQFVPPGGQR